MKLTDLKILVMGANVWGKGDTLAEALKNASKPTHYIAYIVHHSAYVDDMGYITWNTGDEYPRDTPEQRKELSERFQPKKIVTKLPAKKASRATKPRSR